MPLPRTSERPWAVPLDTKWNRVVCAQVKKALRLSQAKSIECKPSAGFKIRAAQRGYPESRSNAKSMDNEINSS